MSTGVDQRGKGQPNQVSNGTSKEPMKEEFDAYFNQQQPQGTYNSGPMSSSSVTEPYMANYYASMTFPYVGQGMDNTAWSNGGDPMSFLGGYGQMNNEYMSSGGMFGGFGYQPGFSWDFPGGDYSSAWGSQPAPRKDDQRAYTEAGYYGIPQAGQMDAGYGAAMNGEMERDMKAMEHGVKNMGIQEKQQEVHHGHSPKDYSQHSSNTGAGEPVQHVPPPQPTQSAPAKKTWASIASQPAKPQSLKPKAIPRAPVLPSKQHNMDIGTWDQQGRGAGSSMKNTGGGGQARQGAWAAPRGRATPSSGAQTYSSPGSGGGHSVSNGTAAGPTPPPPVIPAHPVLDKLRSANQYNPKEFNMNPKNARYFIIKSYSEDDIHRSIKYSVWCSTEHGNKRLDAAYREREGKGPIYLLYSVNGSGHFCGMAQMMSAVDYHSTVSVWAQDKWKGQFEVKWIYVKDVPNSQLRHIKLENNENKPVTNSRDTQEVPPEKGKMVLKIIHNYRHSTSIFDDFVHYEKRQEEDQVIKERSDPPPQREQRNDHRGGDRGDRGGDGRRERNDRGGDRRDDRSEHSEGRGSRRN